MCIGTPMQVISCSETIAICDDNGVPTEVDISLVGEQTPNTWLLVFLGSAREVMEPEIAEKTCQALEAVQAVMNGSSHIDHLFSDLVDREPQLPEHLQELANNTCSQSSTKRD